MLQSPISCSVIKKKMVWVKFFFEINFKIWKPACRFLHVVQIQYLFFGYFNKAAYKTAGNEIVSRLIWGTLAILNI